MKQNTTHTYLPFANRLQREKYPGTFYAKQRWIQCINHNRNNKRINLNRKDEPTKKKYNENANIISILLNLTVKNSHLQLFQWDSEFDVLKSLKMALCLVESTVFHRHAIYYFIWSICIWRAEISQACQNVKEKLCHFNCSTNFPHPCLLHHW